MSSSSGEEVLAEQVIQEILEERLVRRFDFFNVQSKPHRGAVILRFLGGGVLRFVGTDLDEAQVGDIAVEVAHSSFYTRAQVWVKVIDGARGWVSTSDLQTIFYFTSYLA